MDILIMFLVFILFFLVIVKKKTNYKVIALWGVICILFIILYFLHATSQLPITL